MIQKKLRIGILGLAGKPIPTIAGDICAPHAVINNLVIKLKELGHEVTVFTGKDSLVDANIVSAGLESIWEAVGPENQSPIIYTERKVEYDQILSREAIEMYRRKELDVINSHDIRFSPYLFLESKVPVLYTPHFSLDTRDTDFDKYRYKLMKDPLFGVANISKKNIQFCEEKGVKNFGYVPNGIDISKYKFNDQGREGILLVSRMVSGKMVKEIIGIAEKLNQTITLIGPKGNKDEDASYFEELKKDYFTKSHVEYLGFLSPDEIIPYYQKAKVMLFPSKSEGSPLGLLEAMATGLPVVASAVGGIPDVISDGVDGCLVKEGTDGEWQEKIQQALEIKNQLPRKKIEDNFTLEKQTKNYIEAYTNFIENGK